MEEHKNIAHAIDIATDENDRSELTGLIGEIDKILENENSNEPLLNYFRANAFSAKRQTTPNFFKRQFDWIQPELAQEIISLRRAVGSKRFFKSELAASVSNMDELG